MRAFSSFSLVSRLYLSLSNVQILSSLAEWLPESNMRLDPTAHAFKNAQNMACSNATVHGQHTFPRAKLTRKRVTRGMAEAGDGDAPEVEYE
jgi:hypothetical protein